MKTLTINSGIVMLLIAFMSTTTLKAQEWSTDQKAVWQEIDNMWVKWKANELDGAFTNVHEKYQGWNSSEPLPTSKDKWVNSMKAFTNAISDRNYNIEPARIVIYKNVAVVHYYYKYSYVVNTDEQKMKHANSGKWTAFFVLEKNLWSLIGGFTYTESMK